MGILRLASDTNSNKMKSKVVVLLISSLLISSKVLPQRLNMKIMPVFTLFTNGMFLGCEKQISDNESLQLSLGGYVVSSLDLSSIDLLYFDVYHFEGSRIDLRIHVDYRKYFQESKAEEIYGPYFFTHIGLNSMKRDNYQDYYEPPIAFVKIYKYAGGAGVGYKVPTNKNKTSFFEFGLAPEIYLWQNGNSYRDYSGVALRITMAFCFGS